MPLQADSWNRDTSTRRERIENLAASAPFLEPPARFPGRSPDPVPRLGSLGRRLSLQASLESSSAGNPTPSRAGNRAGVTPGLGVDLDDTAENLASLIHDARNMVSAMDLYCDLLDEPGVLQTPFRHYAGELRLIGGASRRLLEKLAIAESVTGLQLTRGTLTPASANWGMAGLPGTVPPSGPIPGMKAETPPRPQPLSDFPAQPLAMGARTNPSQGPSRRAAASGYAASRPIENLAEELSANRNILAALVGPAVTVGMTVSGANRPVPMSGDDLTRILVNLGRNAADAMPGGGHIEIELEETPDRMCLSVLDNGPGISASKLDAVFSPGFSTRDSGQSRFPALPAPAQSAGHAPWPIRHRGLGLSIVRSIVAAAGGLVWAENRPGSAGAAIRIEFSLASAASPPSGKV